MSYSTLSPGISPLRIQKGGSRSPSPTKDAPLPMHPSPTPYTLKPRKASNSSITREGSRRTSSSYSAMRTNSLVKNSPFLNGSEPAGPKHRPAPSGFNVYRNGPPPPSARSSLHMSASSSSERERGSLSGPRPQSKIPTPSRRTSTSSHSMGLAMVPVSGDEPNAHKGYKRRQSKGLQSLPDHERVSKSPFMNSVVERDTPSPHERVHSPGEDEWDTVPETSPELGASNSQDLVPDLGVPEREATPPPPPPKPSVSPPTKPSLSSRLAAITARAFSPPPPSTPPRQDSFSRGDNSFSGRLDTTASLPSTPIQTFPLELAGTPDSAYKTPLSPSHATAPIASSTPVRGSTPLHISTPRDTPTKLDTSSSSMIIHPTPSPSSSPRRRPPSAQSPSPTRSSLVSKRLLGPRSSPSPRSPTTADTSITRTSSGRVTRKLSRRNSRAARKASGGKYVAMTRRGSRKARKRVTFDERCDVLEFDSEVGIDGEVWSDGEEWEEEPKKRYASPPLEAREVSPEMEDRRSPEVEDGRYAADTKRHSTPPAQPAWSSWGNGNGSAGTPPLAHGSKYANIGVEEDYGFGRQAGLRHSGSGASARGTQRVTGSAYRSRDAPRDSDSGSLLASLSGSLSGHGSVDSMGAADAFGRAYPLKVVNSAPGDVDSPEVGWEERAREAGERAKREEEERVRKEEEERVKKEEEDRTRREEDRARREQARRDEQARLRQEEEELARQEEQARRDEEERALREVARHLEAEEHSRSMAEVVVQHSGSAVMVHHTGGRPGVVVHHSGNGMVESVYSREGHEADASIDQGVTVHHSGHSAVQIYDERSPDLSVADVSMANGMSFASLVSFDSIISRSGMGASRIGFGSSSGLGDHGRIEEEEEDSELVGGKILSGLDEVVIKSEEVSVDLGDMSRVEDSPRRSPHDSPRRSTYDEPASPNVRHSAHLDSRPYTPRHLAPALETRHSSPNLSGRMEPQFTGGSVSGRSPRISRDEVLRRLMDRRTGGSLTPTGRASPREESPVREGRAINGPRMSGSRIEIERLMAGVARGFADISGEGSSMGFNPADESHSSLPYRKQLEEEEEEEEEETEPEPEPRPEPVRITLPRAPAADSVASSGETETEIEEAITPPISRSLIPVPRALQPGHRSSAYDSPSQRSSMYETNSQRSSTYEPKRLSMLDPGRASNIMNERPTSYMSVTSTSSKPEMSGKEKIKAHEEMILQKRRELRGGPSRSARRRSKSVSEAVVIGDKLDLLDVPVDNEELALEDSFNEQMRKIHDQDEGRTYHLREPNRTIHADDKVAHHRRAGDVDNGKAWRTVRRPSDMNEYAKEIQEIRAQAGTTKAHGKVFVKVRCLQKLCVPIPQQPTFFTCTLNNGIHFVTTPECQLEPNAMIDQEFELIEHGKLAFSLTIKVRKDQHIVNQIRHMAAPPPQQFMPAPPPPKQGGFRSFFSSTPKKQPKRALLRRPDPVTEDHLVRYMKADGAIGRAHVNFRDIVQRCDTRLFETSYPLIGEWSEDSVRGGGGGGLPSSMMSGHMSQRPIGELVLHIFRLPPLPGVPPETLPQSLEECHRGLSAVAWHKKVYYQGILTQNGGDILTWRRRQFRIIGSNLVAYNDVTGKAMATINLKRALAVEDDQQPLPAGAVPGRRQRDESDAFFVDKRCFRLLFGKDDDIAFYADTPEEKAEWLRILRALVGNIPPHPLWAELVWQRHEQAAAAQALAQQQAQAQANSGNPSPQPEQTPPPPPKPEVPPPRPQAWR